MKRFCLAAIALGVFAGGCSSDPVGPPPRITALPRALTPHEQSLIQADNRLAIKLLQQVNADTRDTLPNLFISPLSVAMALAMAYNGAATTTADAMRSTPYSGSCSISAMTRLLSEGMPNSGTAGWLSIVPSKSKSPHSAAFVHSEAVGR